MNKTITTKKTYKHFEPGTRVVFINGGGGTYVVTGMRPPETPDDDAMCTLADSTQFHKTADLQELSAHKTVTFENSYNHFKCGTRVVVRDSRSSLKRGGKVYVVREMLPPETAVADGYCRVEGSTARHNTGFLREAIFLGTHLERDGKVYVVDHVLNDGKFYANGKYALLNMADGFFETPVYVTVVGDTISVPEGYDLVATKGRLREILK